MKQKIIGVVESHSIYKHVIDIIITEDEDMFSLVLVTKDSSLYAGFSYSLPRLITFMNWKMRIKLKLDDLLKMLEDNSTKGDIIKIGFNLRRLNHGLN